MVLRTGPNGFAKGGGMTSGKTSDGAAALGQNRPIEVQIGVECAGERSVEGIEAGRRWSGAGMLGRWRCRAIAGAAGDVGPGLPPLVARVLAGRGLDGERAAEFLKPTLMQMHDPSLMPDADRAAERILTAMRAGEPIVIYGDYDVDGVTATSILFHVIKAIDAAALVTTYVPHRVEEGYGLNAEAIAELAKGGARVIVSVDCGVTAVGPAKVAREHGVDLIITDHHNPPASEAELPEAYAVVHPRRPGSKYPYGELCGAGVAFKLAWRLGTMAAGGGKVPGPVRALLLDLLALASLGVIADVVPLTGENRVIARFGLSRVKTSPLIGLAALVEASGLSGENVNAEDVGFKLGPRLNACGRMGHARDAVELFTVAGPERAAEIAAMLCTQNDARRKTERAIFEEADAMAIEAGMTGPDRRAIVLAKEGWHPGVVGIVCSRLVERYHRPTILMHRSDGMCGGSGRSIDGYSLHAGLEHCRDLLTSFGGHDMAAGMKLTDGNLPAFVEAFTSHANARIAPSDLVGTFEYDCDASLAEVDFEGVSGLECLSPCGRENPSVRVRLVGVRVIARPEVFGKQNTHLSLRVGDHSGRSMRLVGWGWAERRDRLAVGMTIDALIAPRISVWNGDRRIEGEIADLMVR
jgi:single-stranded-DNA-specific exonuclease